MSDKKEVRTRFAPSPSGYLHLGGARTALFNYLFAKAQNGKFIVRVEDTDQERSTPESERMILDSLKWLNIHADEGVDEGGDFGPYRQSQRLDVYKDYTEKLLSAKKAFPCFCTSEELEAKKKRSQEMGLPNVYDGRCRGLTEAEVKERKDAGEKFAIRFIADPREVVVNDLVQGRVKFDTKLIGDFIIVKSDGFPSYNYAVVVDDHLMAINHVIRGVGHLSNTPRQILIHEALDLELPQYAHISEIVGTDKKKLSKRKGATSVLFFKELGFMTEPFVNYMALLGWYPEDAQEFMPDGELEKKFSLERCSKSPSMFDFFMTDKLGEDFNPDSMSRDDLKKLINNKSKLKWMSNKYIRHMDLDDVFARAKSFIAQNDDLNKILDADESRVKATFDTIRVYLDTLEDTIPYMLEIFKEKPSLEEKAREMLDNEEAKAVVNSFKELVKTKSPGSPEDYQALIKEVGKSTGAKGKGLFMPIRAASTGATQGLELPALFTILGPDTVAERIDGFMTQV